MAAPGTPSNYNLTQGNGQVTLKWALTPTATSYSIQRSTDGVSYSTLGTASLPTYTDITASLGVMYWYKVAGVNGTGTGAYTAAKQAVPAPTGELSLFELRQAARQRADMVNNNYVTDSEWDGYLNQSQYELYDLLITTFEDYNMAPGLVIPSTGATSYLMPNGTNYDAAPPFYKLLGVDMAVNSSTNAWVTMQKFNFIDRNKYLYPYANATIYGVYNSQYRVMGDRIEFIPVPLSTQSFRLWYIPRLPAMIKDTDTTTIGISGWLEYVIIRAAILALNKEESDTSVLMAALADLRQRIESTAQNRDAGRPDTISDSRSANLWGQMGPFGGNGSGVW